MVKNVIFGVLAACGGAFLISGSMGFLVLKEALPIEAAPTAAILLMGLCVFLVCYLLVRKSAKSRLPLAMAMAAAFALLCFLSKAALFPKATFSFGWQSFVPFAAAALAGVMASKKKRVRR